MDEAYNIAHEKASFIRDLAYLQNMQRDSEIQEAVCAMEQHEKDVRGISESVEPDDPEIEEAIRQIPINDDTEEEEIKRIMTSDKSVDIDDVIGIADDVMTDQDIDLSVDEDEKESI